MVDLASVGENNRAQGARTYNLNPKEVLSHPPSVLSIEQRAAYFDQGYLKLENWVSGDWIARLRAASHRIIERSRSVTESNEMFVLDEGHSASSPRLRRLNCAVDYDPASGNTRVNRRRPMWRQIWSAQMLNFVNY